MNTNNLSLFMLIILSLFLSLSTQAESPCSKTHPKYSQEHSVSIGTDWPLYAWTKVPFRKDLPSVLFFNGGPGQSSHGSDWTLPGWNVIFWDQRGVGCSKPIDKAKYYEFQNYSIENTARDAIAVLDQFGIEKASLLAVSYGTAPATVVANFYPERVRALVLEGTLFTGSAEHLNFSYPIAILRRYHKELPADLKVSLENWSRLPGLSATWFSRVGFYFLNIQDGLSKLTEFLKVLQKSDTVDLEFLNNFGPRAFEDEELGFSAVVFAGIACQELSHGTADSRGGLHLDANGLHLVEDLPTRELCERYQIQASRPFLASRYPVRVPISYFQGALESATPLPLALQHFSKVAKGAGYFYIRRAGGHGPLVGEILSEYPDSKERQVRYQTYLLKSLEGKPFFFSREDRKNWIRLPRPQLMKY